MNTQTPLLDFMRRLIGELLASNNAELSMECLAVVVRMPGYESCSMAEIGRRNRVSRAAVSKRCAELARALNLKPIPARR